MHLNERWYLPISRTTSHCETVLYGLQYSRSRQRVLPPYYDLFSMAESEEEL